MFEHYYHHHQKPQRIYSPARYPHYSTITKSRRKNRPPLIPGRVIIRTLPRTRFTHSKNKSDGSSVYSRGCCSDTTRTIITDDDTTFDESEESTMTLTDMNTNHPTCYECNECPICMEPLLFNNNNDNIVIGTTVPCGHCFHWDCFQQYYRNHQQQESGSFPTCPVCQEMTFSFIRIYLSPTTSIIPTTTQKQLMKTTTTCKVAMVEDQKRENVALKEENFRLQRMILKCAEKKQQDDSLLNRIGRWIQERIQEIFVSNLSQDNVVQHKHKHHKKKSFVKTPISEPRDYHQYSHHVHKDQQKPKEDLPKRREVGCTDYPWYCY